MKNNPVWVARRSKALLKAKGAFDKYNVPLICEAFLNASVTEPHDEMFKVPEHLRLHVQSCKGIAYATVSLAQKGTGKNIKQVSGEEQNDVRNYELYVRNYLNSLMYWCVENNIHFNWDLYIAFLHTFKEKIDAKGYGIDAINRLLNMIPGLWNSYLFMPTYTDTTGLNWEAPVDQRRDGKVFTHDNEWNRLREWINKRQTKARVETRNVGPVF